MASTQGAGGGARHSGGSIQESRYAPNRLLKQTEGSEIYTCTVQSSTNVKHLLKEFLNYRILDNIALDTLCLNTRHHPRLH